MIAIDTNILVYAHDPACHEHQAASQALQKAAATDAWGWPLSVAQEFWCTVTRAALNDRGTRARAARTFLAEMGSAGAVVWYPQPGFADRLLRAAERARCYGPSVFDLQIALTAAEHFATEIWTHDHGFPSVAGLRVVDPIG